MVQWNAEIPRDYERIQEGEAAADLREALYEKDEASEANLERIGHPEELAEYWREQPTRFDCAFTAEESALKALGVNTTVEELRRIDEATFPQTYIRDGGPTPDQLGFGFAHYGVGCDTFTSDNPIQAEQYLVDTLRQDKAVLVAVDADTLWDDGNSKGGHAIWVTGADVRPDGSIERVWANDSGIPDGRMKEYPGDTFMNAWEPYRHRMASSVWTVRS
ncbi:MAG: hypothetical protein L0177_00680 [Chloroflexi bacterium]|nr:hypothetical protein [Chloroflexota bacterium]